MAKTDDPDDAYRQRVVEAYWRSGKSLRAFAAEEPGLSWSTLANWSRKLRKQDAGGASSTKATRAQEGARESAAQTGKSAFLPVRVTDAERAGPPPGSASSYELVLGKGVLRLPADFDPDRVAALLRAAEVVC